MLSLDTFFIALLVFSIGFIAGKVQSRPDTTTKPQGYARKR